MVFGWQRAFCTSTKSKNQERASCSVNDIKSDANQSPRIRSRFGGFFSNPSTPRLQPPPVSAVNPMLRCASTTNAGQSDEQPPTAAVQADSGCKRVKLQCKTRDCPRLIFPYSAPSSPRSPSTFSFLRSNLRFSKSGFGEQRVKTGDGTASFTAECSHSSHFPCVSSQVIKNHGSLVRPVCSPTWKEMNGAKRSSLRVYDDDEPLSSPASGGRFIPIPESDETEEENEEFSGFSASSDLKFLNEMKTRNSLEISLWPEVAVVSVGKSSETIAVILKIKAPAAPARGAAVDLVTVLDVSRSITAEKLHLIKKGLRLIVSSLSASDRLSIVAFSATSKRLLPLRRMTAAGKKSARRIIDAAIALDCDATAASESLKKAAKVIQDRRQRNPTASILLFTDGHRSDPFASSSQYSHMKIPIHSFNLSACINAPPDSFSKSINGVLRAAAVKDLEIQLGTAPGSPSDEIRAVYSYSGRSSCIGCGSGWFPAGDFQSEEVKELLLELKFPSTLLGTHRFLSVRCSYKDPSTQQRIHDKERSIIVPHARSSRSSPRRIQWLKCLFLTTRAIVESRRLVARNDIAGAHHMLASARAVVLQSDEEFVRRLEAELSELTSMRKEGRKKNQRGEAEPYTPTSAWKAAERLAKVAIMKKSLNRVSDLHGFEDARF